MKYFDQEFDKFKDMLKRGENFSFSRFSDGECFILQNKKVVLGNNFYITGDKAGANIYGPEERKSFDPEDNIDQGLRQHLIKSFEHKQKNYFKGIPSKQDIHIDFDHEDEDDLTFANIFINANYERFIEEIVLTIFPERLILYVVNERADLSGLPFKVDKDFRIGSNCLRNNFDVINKVQNYIIDECIRDAVVLSSAASLSNLINYYGFSALSDNTFLDIGSSLNPYLGEKMQSCMYTRDYLKTYWLKQKTYYGEMVDEWK